MRLMALSFLRRNALAIGVAASVGACSDDLLPDCKRDPAPTLQIDTSSFPLGVVTTQGACTQVHCAEPNGNGCRLWEGELTSVNAIDRCEILLSLPDGQRQTRQVVGSGQCGAPLRQRVVFLP